MFHCCHCIVFLRTRLQEFLSYLKSCYENNRKSNCLIRENSLYKRLITFSSAEDASAVGHYLFGRTIAVDRYNYKFVRNLSKKNNRLSFRALQVTLPCTEIAVCPTVGTARHKETCEIRLCVKRYLPLERFLWKTRISSYFYQIYSL